MAEGTYAHAQLEALLRGREPQSMDPKTYAGVSYAVDIVNEIRQQQRGRYHEGIEEKVSLEHCGLPEVWGTADYILRCIPYRLIIIDYKNGAVPVPASSAQLLTYAVGAAGEEIELYQEITCCIIQPNSRDGRMDSWYTLSPAELLRWQDRTLIPAINEAKGPNPRAIPGESQCRWCQAKHGCKEYRDAALDVAQTSFLDLIVHQTPVLWEPKAMLPDELATVYGKLGLIKDWIKSIEGTVAGRLERGLPVPGYKRVQGRASRSFVDIDLVSDWILEQAPELSRRDLWTESFVSPAQAEKLLPKSLKKGLASFQHVTYGAPSIVSADHPKPAIDVSSEFIDLATT